jgi:carboxylesterase type B
MPDTKYITVDTEYGPVKGSQKVSDLGRDFFSFRAIPYMKAPVGNLRFRDAKEPDSWIEPLDVTGARPSYTSLNFMTKAIEGQEDAGIISIDTPYLDKKLPVAVYIHGGGFQGA